MAKDKTERTHCIHIRNVDAETLKRLRVIAAQAGLTMNELYLRLLNQCAGVQAVNETENTD